MSNPEEIRGLIEKAQRGDVEAYNEAYRKIYKEVWLFVCRRIKNVAREKGIQTDEEDWTSQVVSEAFLRSTKELRSFKGQSAFKTWVIGFAKNIIRENIKKKGNYDLRIDWDDPKNSFFNERLMERDKGPSVGPEEMLADTDRLEEAKKIIESLPERQRKVLELRIFEQLSIRETAERLCTTIPSVKNAQARALKGIEKRRRESSEG